jgi:hypothetical protein
MMTAAHRVSSLVHTTELANLLQAGCVVAFTGTQASGGVSRAGETDVVLDTLDDSRAAVRDSWRALVMIGLKKQMKPFA